MAEQIIKMRNIIKRFYIGKPNELEILHGINMTVNKGEFVAIVGPSGSGKSTLMNIIGCLDSPSEGEYILNGHAVDELNEKQLAGIRNREIGFIFQNSQLLHRLDALQNVELPLVYAGVRPKERARRAKEMLERVGLSERMHHFPNQLSGGQQQRVAIARALVTNPKILLADEPTGALDQKTGRQIMTLFEELHQEGHTIIMITHDLKIAGFAKRVVHIIDGCLTEEEKAVDAV